MQLDFDSFVFTVSDAFDVNFCFQDEEYVKADKVLRNSTMTLIKKRGLMANLFGDYRTKMKQDEANSSNNKSKLLYQTLCQPPLVFFNLAYFIDTAKIVTTDQNKLIKKAKFVRKSNARSDPSDTTKSGCNDELKKAFSNLTIKDDNTNTGEVESKKIPESCAAQMSKFNITGGNSDFKFNFVI